MSEAETPMDMVALVREVIAAHLGVEITDVPPTATLGSHLALDSLDVFAVVEGIAERLGSLVTLNYADPQAVDCLGDLSSLTVADFVGCLLIK
jgi:acyl carrier protein